MKINDILKHEKELRPIKVLILSNILGISKSDIILNSERKLNTKEYKKYIKALNKYKKGYPVQYILKETYFYGNKYYVDKNVLIPRPETEILVEKTVELIKKNLGEKINIIDIGTGSGAIAITLKKLLPDATVTATDISKKILKIAKYNAEINEVDINFKKSDILKNINDKYDVIISNPPYISYDEKIEDIVQNNEPKKALYAPFDGIYFYKEILKQSEFKLNKKNIIAFEIGSNQEDKIKKLVTNNYKYDIISAEKDLNGLDRYIFILNKRW